MVVLSLFDGHSGGQIALNKAGIKYDTYFASEIDRAGIKETQANYPDTIQLGDVKDISYKNGILSNGNKEYKTGIDLLIGGSPCQSFSLAGKMEGFDGKSGLFFEYLRLLREINPKYFLLENVVTRKEWIDHISSLVGVEPIEINSSLVSAQVRKRLYWTNIPNVGQPKDRNIKLSDILEKDKDWNKGNIIGRRLNENGIRKDNDNTVPMTQCLEVRASNTDKSNCLTTVDKNNVLTPLPVGRYADAFGMKSDRKPFRYYSITELCRMQTVPENYFKVSSDSQIRKMLGNGWTVDVIAHIFTYLELSLKENCSITELRL